jgi:hypothetical protein
VVEIFTFDIVIEFFIKNTSKFDYQNVTIDLFAPTNLDIIEKAPQISLAANEAKTIRSCIKFSSTCNSFIFGQVTYANSKGALGSLNLSGIFIDLLVTIFILIFRILTLQIFLIVISGSVGKIITGSIMLF